MGNTVLLSVSKSTARPIVGKVYRHRPNPLDHVAPVVARKVCVDEFSSRPYPVLSPFDFSFVFRKQPVRSGPGFFSLSPTTYWVG